MRSERVSWVGGAFWVEEEETSFLEDVADSDTRYSMVYPVRRPPWVEQLGGGSQETNNPPLLVLVIAMLIGGAWGTAIGK